MEEAQRVTELEDLAYGWTEEDLHEQELEKRLLEGKIWQLQLHSKQPWGIFIVEFKNAKVYKSDLRKILRGLVPSRRRDATLAAWKHDNLLFLCTTKDYESVTFAHFRGEKAQTARLAAFGWQKDDRNLRTLCEFNLPALVWPEDGGKDRDKWLKQWAAAFDKEPLTKSPRRKLKTPEGTEARTLHGVTMDQHELLSKHTIELFQELVCGLECEDRLTFADDEDRETFMTAVLRLFQQDLRTGIRYERERWLKQSKNASTQ